MNIVDRAIRRISLIAGLLSIGYGIYEIDSPWAYITAGLFIVAVMLISADIEFKEPERKDLEGKDAS